MFTQIKTKIVKVCLIKILNFLKKSNNMKVILPLIIGVSFVISGCSSSLSKTQTAEQIALAQSKALVDELKKGSALYFNNNSSEVNDKYNIYLMAASNFLKVNNNFVLTLEGHTDNSGGRALNKRISLERANAVRYQMIREYSTNPAQIVAKGVGYEKPIASNDTAEGRAKNRRVVATLKLNSES